MAHLLGYFHTQAHTYTHKNIRRWRLQKAWQYDLYEAAPLIQIFIPPTTYRLYPYSHLTVLKLPIDSALTTCLSVLPIPVIHHSVSEPMSAYVCPESRLIYFVPIAAVSWPGY